MSNRVYERITDAIVKRLEEGTVPCHKPWEGGEVPRNFVSRRPYRGINIFLLAMQAFESPFWLTFRQAQELGGKIRKGAKSTPVVFWKWYEKTEEADPDRDDAETERVPVLRYYNVFNVAQCEGIDCPRPPVPVGPFEPIDAAEKIAQGYPSGPRIVHRGSQALYRPPGRTSSWNGSRPPSGSGEPRKGRALPPR